MLDWIRKKIRLYKHAKELADALYEMEDECAIYMWHDVGTDRKKAVLLNAQSALIKSGKGVKSC